MPKWAVFRYALTGEPVSAGRSTNSWRTERARRSRRTGRCKQRGSLRLPQAVGAVRRRPRGTAGPSARSRGTAARGHYRPHRGRNASFGRPPVFRDHENLRYSDDSESRAARRRRRLEPCERAVRGGFTASNSRRGAPRMAREQKSTAPRAFCVFRLPMISYPNTAIPIRGIFINNDQILSYGS